MAGYRSWTGIAEWVYDVPVTTVIASGIDPDRRPSEGALGERPRGLTRTDEEGPSPLFQQVRGLVVPVVAGRGFEPL